LSSPIEPALSCHAFVLTAGLGTRFRPLSFERAKAAAPVAGVPLVHRILRWLVSQGVRDALLNLHHRPETIARIVGDGSDVGCRVRYSWEPIILGSAGGPRLALDLIESDPFLLVNGDTLTDLDLGLLLRAHAASDALVTMAVIPNPEPAWYGGVAADQAGVVTGFPRAGQGRGHHFIGVQVARKEAFAGIAPGNHVESVGELYSRLMAERPGSVRAFLCDAAFRDVGTPADYLRTCLDVADAERNPSSLTSSGRVAAGARVEQSVLWDDAVVETGAQVTGSVIGSGVRVGGGTVYRDAVVVAAAGREPVAGERLEHGLLVAPIVYRQGSGGQARL
jgi:NDP-sugar pyrophosphorylase family protein